MRCSNCNGTDTKVIESRDVSEGVAIRRRRECIQCQTRFTTYERIEKPQLVVVKHGGARQLFSREKLQTGILRACQKTSVTAPLVENIVDSVEKRLYARGESEVSSNDIGKYVMEELSRLDEVAYIRFASVYRRFKDVSSFEKELADIKKHLQQIQTQE